MQVRPLVQTVVWQVSALFDYMVAFIALLVARRQIGDLLSDGQIIPA
jgi:hypothetical protein